jgi:ATP-binding cassette subfamily F protein uup
VRALSGGERNRLLLARLLTRPANTLVLDEPTNDLDLETLELLEQQLVDWPGTLLIVSHDRRFLDNVVTSTLAFEGNGVVGDYVGGYEDYLRQKTSGSTRNPSGSSKNAPGNTKGVSGGGKDSSGNASPAGKTKKKRSFKEEREYTELPGRMSSLEEEKARLQAAVAAPAFYKETAAVIRDTLARIDAIDGELLRLLEKWDELDSRGK